MCQLKKEKEDAENETYSEICSKFLNVNKADGLKDPCRIFLLINPSFDWH